MQGPRLAARLDGLTRHPLVGEVRYKGMLAAIELVADKGTKARFDASLGLADRLSAAGYERGIIFRAFADGTIGLAPALTATEEEVHAIVDRLTAALDDVLDQPEIRAALR